MKYQKGQLLYDGKAKRVFGIVDEPGLLWQEFKDSLTAFNSEKKGEFANKGVLNRNITSLVFRFLQKHDPDNTYKTVVLGPIRTNITRHYAGPSGFGKKLLDFLSRDPEQFVPVLTAFAENKRKVLYYPLGVYVFYWFMKVGLKLMPFAYLGTRKSPPTVTERVNRA